MTNDWIHQTNIYEVNLRQYTAEGSFEAFAPHLPRLRDMGVQTLWFMPITPISQKEKKGSLGSYYACSDYTAVSAEFGTLEGFRQLVRQCHNMGFKVIIDWVANHTGWDHVWTREHPDWYEKDEQGGFRRASGMEDIIELDYRNMDMRRAMMEAMKFWIRTCDIDGFRCDLASWVELDFWLQAIPEINQLKPLFWLGEMDPIENPGYMQVFHAAYGWIWMHKTEAWYQKSLPLLELTSVLDGYDKAPGMKAWFTSNHDENSWNGSEYEKYGDAAAVLAVYSCTWPGVPLVYSGQEIPNKKRLEFFEKDPLEWTAGAQLHGFYRALLSLQSQHPALDARADCYRLATSSGESIFAFLRKNNEAEVIVILNMTANFVRFDVQSYWARGSFQEVFSGSRKSFPSEHSFEMKPWEYLVYVKDQIR